MKKKPLIGVTPGFANDKNRVYINRGYLDGINEAGGFAVLLPLSMDEGLLEEAAGRCDGILLSGGPDADAKYFGELNLGFAGEISPYRDTMEVFIAKRAIEQGIPVFGICRGIQILNIALGGTLFQDIHAQIKDRELIKHSQEAPQWYPTHDIHIEGDSIIRHCFGKECIAVNSFHHQAVKNPGKGLRIVARSPDGIIEAVEHKGHVFAVGVQWHPELMWQENREFLKLFEAFVQAAGNK